MSESPWVLIVDDDEDIRDVISMLLRRKGYDADSAADGLIALNRIRARGRPALVLLDLRMPNMSGSEFIAAVREDSLLRNISIVVLSGDAVAIQAVEGLGVQGYIRKPCDFSELIAAVQRFAGAPANVETPRP
jgi:two-component system response regulator MprA